MFNTWKTTTSTYHLLVKFPTEYGIGEARGGQMASRNTWMLHSHARNGRSFAGVKHRGVISHGRNNGRPRGNLLDNNVPSWITHIGTQANPLVRKELALFLKNNQDVFAWTHKDMLGINPSVMVHKLNVSPSFLPVRQKKRVFTQERDKAIVEKVRKLLEADFIREMYYLEWLVNLVIVKKANDKWKMCVDFTNLNRAYLKDSYPLPHINLLMDLTAGH